MDTIELFMRPEPGERLHGERLRRLLREWIERTGRAAGLVDVQSSVEGDDAVARIREDRRVLEVRLHQEGGDLAHRLLVDASTWVMPELPPRRTAWVAGLVAGLLGLLVTWTLLDAAAVTALVGTIASVLLAVVVANTVWRRTVTRRVRQATDEAGGQRPASAYLSELDEVIRRDDRVESVSER